MSNEQGVVISGSGWKPALRVTVGKCVSICLRIRTMPLPLAGSQYQSVPIFGLYEEITRKSAKHLVVSFLLCIFAFKKISNMWKLAFLLCFILSVYPADVNENRRHIHVVRRGSKKSHRGNTVAKIWIEENGEKKIEIAWSELSADEETMILDAIEKHWILLNKQIDDVFAGKKIKIVTLKK